MSRLRTCSEVLEAAALLGEIDEVTRQAAGLTVSRGERLQRALAELCTRARLRGAAIADEQGLALAVHEGPFRVESVGAAASILGHALAHAGKVLDRAGAHTIALESGLDEKIVVRRFDSDDVAYYLVVICPPDLDERAEVELSLAQLTSIVGARAGAAGASS